MVHYDRMILRYLHQPGLEMDGPDNSLISLCSSVRRNKVEQDVLILLRIFIIKNVHGGFLFILTSSVFYHYFSIMSFGNCIL